MPDRKKAVQITTSDPDDDGKETKTYTISGADGGSLEATVGGIPVDDDKILRGAKDDSPNPKEYSWEVKRTRTGAMLDVSAIATRVFADLHHRSLNVSKHEPFTPSEDNPIFYAKSTYDPKDPAKTDAKKNEKKK